MNNRLPNFLIVGTARAATTTIHEYLKQHPDIYMTEWKEPSFFTFKDKENASFTTGRPVKFVTKVEDYQSLFKGAENKLVRGESSTPYLYFYKQTIPNIKETISNYEDIKILIVLRNPIERAYSQYMMKVRDLVEDMPFMNALLSERNRKEENAHFDFFYSERGLYYNQVKAYIQHFKHVKIVFYEDFKENNELVLDEIIDFLNLKKINFQSIGFQNISGKPKVKLISRLLKEDFFVKRKLKKVVPDSLLLEMNSFIMRKNLNNVKMGEEAKNYLRNYYSEDVKKLEELLAIDLSKWLK